MSRERGFVRYPKDHSTETKCRCGGHSANDHKKSKSHHSTAVRLARRKERRRHAR